MAEYLMREQAPLSAAQWERIDQTVTSVAERNLVGRRIIPLFGPFGPGMQAIPSDVFTGVGGGAVDMLGEEDGGIIQSVSRRYLPLPVIYKDFRLHWRDLESAATFDLPLEISVAAAAAAFCARTEDDLIFNGREIAGTRFDGLLTVEGRSRVPMSDWGQMGNAFEDIVKATQALIEAEFFGPFAVVVSPRQFANMNRLLGNSGILEVEQAQKIAAAGVYQSPVLGDKAAVVVSVGAENMDLAVAQDLVTAFLETSKMNHFFRVLEILALRIKRPGAVCTIEA